MRTPNIVQRLETYFDRLWPICRSITGPGFRESLDILSEIIPTERLKFESGKKVFDWVVPKEWIIRKAYLIDPKGKKRADFEDNNLHILNYSTPFSGVMPLSELKSHLYTLPEQPEAIPYVTSYYNERWGFCLSHRELMELPEGDYKVLIDSELRQGHVEVGEAVLRGETPEEILFSSYLCHPSLANNELSGPLLLAFLYEALSKMKRRRYTYRFVIVPETIGSICYLSVRGQHLKEFLSAGYVVTCVGDPGHFTYKLSRDGNTLTDRVAKLVLRDFGKHKIIDFFPSGSDERQYCSPGFNLPVGSLMRTPYGCYPEYHTSLDNKSFISFEALAQTLSAYELIVRGLEANAVWKGTVQHCEPQLGRRGLYPTLGTKGKNEKTLDAMMWILNLADGTRDLLSIAERSGCNLDILIMASTALAESGLLEKISAPVGKASEIVKAID